MQTDDSQEEGALRTHLRAFQRARATTWVLATDESEYINECTTALGCYCRYIESGRARLQGKLQFGDVTPVESSVAARVGSFCVCLDRVQYRTDSRVPIRAVFVHGCLDKKHKPR